MANGWGWPFSGGYAGYEEGQQFGFTSYPRGNTNFHDGFDFGSAKYPGTEMHAIHDGEVVYAGFAPAGYEALGTVIVTLTDSGYYIVYQEFGTSTANIHVSVGQQVAVGQVIGTRNTSHLHLGITKKEWLAAQASAFTNDGTWLDPIVIIEHGVSDDTQTTGGNKMFCLYSNGGATYFCSGDALYVLTDPAQINILQAIYNANTGKDMPTFDWNAPNPTSGLLLDVFRHKVDVSALKAKLEKAQAQPAEEDISTEAGE